MRSIRLLWLSSAALCALATACAGPRPFIVQAVLCAVDVSCPGPEQYVTAGEDGVLRLRIRASEPGYAERTAIRGAKDYCSYAGREAVFIEQSTEYSGALDEATRGTIRAAGRAAGVLGAERSRRGSGGRVLHGGSAAAQDLTGGDDYLADIAFRCR